MGIVVGVPVGTVPGVDAFNGHHGFASRAVVRRLAMEIAQRKTPQALPEGSLAHRPFGWVQGGRGEPGRCPISKGVGSYHQPMHLKYFFFQWKRCVWCHFHL